MDMDAAQGLEAVYLANRDRLARFLAAHGAGDASEDLLQELWLKLRAAPSGPVGAPLSYLFRMANNLMIDRHRALRQARRRDEDWSDAIGPAIRGTSDAPSGERALIARQRLGLIEVALEQAGPRAAAIFRRHRVDGVGQRAIAAEMGVSLSTVESDLRKAYALIADARRAMDEA